MKKFDRFIGLAGMPRAGSTLLGAILDQNPDIHSEGNSAVCDLMWSMQYACRVTAQEQLTANYRISTQRNLVSEIPNIYYKDVKKKIILDKCRVWTEPENFRMLNEYFHQKPKVIVLERSLTEVLKSCLYVKKINNTLTNQEWTERELLSPNSEPIIRSWHGLNWAKKNNHGEFLFISYSDILINVNNVLDSIYNFIEMPKFNHDLNNIIVKRPENDDVYGCPGLHDIRPSIVKRNYEIELSDEAKNKIKELEELYE